MNLVKKAKEFLFSNTCVLTDNFKESLDVISIFNKFILTDTNKKFNKYNDLITLFDESGITKVLVNVVLDYCCYATQYDIKIKCLPLLNKELYISDNIMEYHATLLIQDKEILDIHEFIITILDSNAENKIFYMLDGWNNHLYTREYVFGNFIDCLMSILDPQHQNNFFKNIKGYSYKSADYSSIINSTCTERFFKHYSLVNIHNYHIITEYYNHHLYAILFVPKNYDFIKIFTIFSILFEQITGIPFPSKIENTL